MFIKISVSFFMYRGQMYNFFGTNKQLQPFFFCFSKKIRHFHNLFSASQKKLTN